MTVAELLGEILRFRDERDWRQFHTSKNLAAALSIEASEMQELFLWKTDAEVREFVQSIKGKKRVEEEIADVLIYALLLSFEVGVDAAMAVERKLIVNAKKYPAKLAKGNALKYSELRALEIEKRESEPDKEAAVPLHEQFSLFPGGSSPVQ